MNIHFVEEMLNLFVSVSWLDMRMKIDYHEASWNVVRVVCRLEKAWGSNFSRLARLATRQLEAVGVQAVSTVGSCCISCLAEDYTPSSL
jgi:hypothetical protein